MKNNTFVALATPYISSAISIIRINGENAYEIVNKIVDNKLIKKGYSVQKLLIYDENKEIVDESIFVKFVAPKSFTGDDLIEINCHGGTIVIDKIISLLLKNGARLAENGEFTKRAFINNNISLSQANSINNLIKAQTESLAKLSINNIVSQNKNKELMNIKNKIFNIIGKIEVNIDYPEYDDVEVINHENLISYLYEIILDIKKIINNYKKISHIYNGINVAIIGKPNVGKSSLLNALLKKDRAIISNIAGTTRDTINESVVINDILFNFIDTAGIRESKNKIESIGIKKSIQAINESDFVIFMIDNSKPMNEQEKKIYKKIKIKNHIVVKNKSDLKRKANSNIDGVNIIAKNNDIQNLIDYLSNEFKITNETLVSNNSVIASKEELIKIQDILAILEKSLNDAYDKLPIDIIVGDITVAYKNISIMLGESMDFDILDDLFKNFCLGK